MLDSGLPQTEIAAQLNVSVSTLKKQTGSIYRKLGVGSRREALHIAHVHGLIDGIQAAQATQSGQRR
ncbi:LuxR C-terminal-related transcriptional regulator [Leucobacter sp. G161]|uniref:helix-turn-helix transcriptional regulator n=1 Tax=Leucobacter sp. G161 TaxID=663704 RepID=UPI000A8DB35B